MPSIAPKFSRLWHGADYNPDQWQHDQHVLEDDFRLAQLANVNALSVAIFAWAKLEPTEGRYDFDWLDRTFDRAEKHGIAINLATPSSSPPRWLLKKHPEILQVDKGRVRGEPGCRQRFCHTIPIYREHVARINTALAQRYAKHPALAMWHISNEYHNDCWCDLCVAAWRDWLKARYGTLDNLNVQWWAAFWSNTFSSWDEVHPNWERTGYPNNFNGQVLDWKRFQSHQCTEFMKHEIATLRTHSPNIPVTTNMMGFFPHVDYAKQADVIDYISWDCYPTLGGDMSQVAFAHAYMRGLKSNKPWLLMEQSPSATNWQGHGTLKPPGVLRLWSYQAIAHGSDSAMYFQFRRGLGGSEKYHGAIIEHEGTEKPRVFQEVAALGAELNKLSRHLIGTTVTPARIGILYDTECRWAFEGSQGFSHDKNYVTTIGKHYRALWRQNIPVNLVRTDDDWSQYDILIAPVWYMVKSGTFPHQGSPEQLKTKLNEARKIEAFVNAGGTFVTTYLSGLVNESDLVYPGGYPAPLRKLLGIWAEEIDCHAPGSQPNRMRLVNNFRLGHQTAYDCDRFFDLIHTEGAQVLAVYATNWYAGRPCLTRNTFGKGSAYYLATDADDAFLIDLYAALAAEKRITPLAEQTDGIEVLERVGPDRRLLFILNHTPEDRTLTLKNLRGIDLLTDNSIDGTLDLSPYGLALIAIT